MSLGRLELVQTTEEIYDEKIALAYSRIARRATLQKALGQKQAENISSRYQLEANLEREKLPEITKFVTAGKDQGLTPEQSALASFRKATLLHFLSYRKDIINQMRQEFVMNRCHQKPTISQILEYIMPKAIIDYSHSLSSEDKFILYGKINGSVQIDMDLFHLAVVYPLESHRPVDLYVLQDVNAFYGHIVGVLSGLGKTEWSSGHEQEERFKEELKNYSVDQDNLPQAREMAPLSEELRIFLIVRAMRLQIQTIVDQKKNDGRDFESNLCQIFLAKYGPITGNPETYEILSRLEQLPSISQGIGKRIYGIFGQTKEKFLKQFEQKHPILQPVQKVYSALKLIADLGNLKAEHYDNDLQLFQELARIFAEDLRQALALIKMGTNLAAEIILDRIISAGSLVGQKLIKKN